MKNRTILRRAEALAAVCLIACLGASGLHAATQTTNFDPAAATVGNARLLETAMMHYAEDNDETLPPTQNVTAFQTALRFYVSDPAIFLSQITGKPFVPNPALSGQSLPALGNLSTTEAFRDVLPPSTIAATVGFLDGHIERGGIVQDKSYDSSYQNAQALAIAVIEYTQDNDETYPPMNTQAAFQAAIYPFVRNNRTFIDPYSGKPFIPNPALSRVTLTAIADPSTTMLLQSAAPYKDNVPTIAYADGHVTPAPPSVTSQRDVSNLKQIGLAFEQYTQDDDEHLPPTNNYAAFEDALAPYTKDTSLFVSPATGLPYIQNTAISGVSLASIDFPSETEEARDAQVNPDGTLNHLEVDGQVRQDLYFVPKSLTVTPDDQTHLFWPKANQQAAFWTLLPGGITKFTDTLNAESSAIAFGLGADSRTHILWRKSYNTDYPANLITGAVTVDTLAADGTLEDSAHFGPYDGWTALFLATGADNNSRLLWQNYDGRLALWTLSPAGDYLGSVSLPAPISGNLAGLSLGTDGLIRLLATLPSGKGHLWTLSESGKIVGSVGLSSLPGATLNAFSVSADGASHLLYSSGKNSAVVLTLAAHGGFVNELTFKLPGGGSAAQIALGQSGDLRVLWENSDGNGKLQTLTPQGKQKSVQSLLRYQ
jgi:hypothetical protein